MTLLYSCDNMTLPSVADIHPKKPLLLSLTCCPKKWIQTLRDKTNGFSHMYAHPRKGKEVNTTNTRIKKLRKALDLTQAEFASRIGTTQNSVANYEIGHRNPSSSVVNNICKEFHVNETWLRTGEGEMLLELAREDEISAFINDVLRDESADFKRRLIAALSRLGPEGWDALEQLVEDTAQKLETPAEPGKPRAPWDTPEEEDPRPDPAPHIPPGYSSRAELEAEARAEAEEVYHQILKEKIAEAGYSASPPGGGKLA